MGPLAYVSQYALKMIKKIQTEYIGSIAPKQDVTDSFNEHVQEWIRHTVWTDVSTDQSLKRGIALTPCLGLPIVVQE